MKQKRIFPAEWHKQSGVQLTWPHAGTDWAYMLDEVEQCFLQIAEAVSARQRLLVVSPEAEKVFCKLRQANVNVENVRMAEAETNDTWARDHGGIIVLEGEKKLMLDFKFNGWGLKFAADKDNLITKKLFEKSVFCAERENHLNFVLEGGSVESDGQGTLLTTAECLLSPNRNGAFAQAEIEQYLKNAFGVENVLWLHHGYLAGDDTDSHIDTLARFCPGNGIAYVRCTDANDEHFAELKAMEDELKTFRNASGEPFLLFALPMPTPIIVDGKRLPATYANFLIMNDAVLLPVYGQPGNDAEAQNVLRQAFPGYEIVPINCTALIKQHGSLHCVTMQFPEGVLE